MGLKRLSRRPLPMRGAAKTPLPRSAAHQGNWAMVFIRGRLRPAMAMVDLELLMVQESMEEAMVLPSMLLQQPRFRLLPRPPAVTVKSDCREVTKEICTNTPKKTST